MTDTILISTKRTALDYNLDDHTLGELAERYDWDELEALCESHTSHYDTLATVEHVLDEYDVEYETVVADLASWDLMDGRDAVISVGGDGTVLETAKYVEDDTPLLSLRSDGRSRGGLCTFGQDDATDAIRAVAEDAYEVEEWTRIEGDHGATTDIGLNEIFVGAADATDAAYYTIRHNGREERQQSSGIVISTGAGSTGWYRNVDDHTPFDREAEELRYVVREPMDGSRLQTVLGWLPWFEGAERYTLQQGVIRPGDEFVIRSHMNDDKRGITRYDGDKRDRTYTFSRGKELRVSIADTPLHVVTDVEL